MGQFVPYFRRKGICENGSDDVCNDGHYILFITIKKYVIKTEAVSFYLLISASGQSVLLVNINSFLLFFYSCFFIFNNSYA